MADICLCNMHNCPKRSTCVRYVTFPDPIYQAYFAVEKGKEDKFIKNCGYYFKKEIIKYGEHKGVDCEG